MRKFFMGFGTVAMFAGIIWGMFDHAWVILCVSGMIISWTAAHWTDD